VRTPFVQQMETTECGAAALAILLAHHHRYVPLEELRIACGTSRDGAKASNILKAARRYGMHAEGVHLTPQTLTTTPPPLILFWEFNHFLVFEGRGRRFGREVVHLNDPARGHRVVSAEEFGDGFTGVALRIRPGAGFRPGRRRPGRLEGVAAHLRGALRPLALSVASGLLLTFAALATAGFTRAFVDTRLQGQGDSVLPVLFSMMGAAILAVLVLTVVRQSLLLRVRIVSGTRNSARLMRHLLALPVAFVAQRSTADLTRRLSSVDGVALTLTTDLVGIVVNAAAVVIYTCLLLTYSLPLTALTVALSLLNIVAVRYAALARAGRAGRLATDETKLFTASVTGLQLIEPVKASGAEDEHFRTWASALAKVVSGRQDIGGLDILLAVTAPALAAVNSAGILLIGGLQAAHGQMTAGALAAVQVLVTAFTTPVIALNATAGRIQDFGIQLARLRDVETFPSDEDRQPPLGETPRRLLGHLALEHVTFGYNPTAPPLLSDLSLSVGPGEQLALVGGSGSGKSTVSRLIAGLHRPWDGSITIDGVRRDLIPGPVLASSVAFVDQDIVLFHGTVKQNITLWDPTVPDEDVVAALHDAAVYEVVATRPGGIHSLIEEDGRNFSGGQAQRLEIARALVRNPALLVLDEATSALDAEVEHTVTDNIRRRGCALVVVAHRLSTVRDSDEIVVLDQGRVSERGTHERLLAAGGRYHDLVKKI
jgi:NHLM bacteriocin system ABC transporter peptidase/ATP-binding protein